MARFYFMDREFSGAYFNEIGEVGVKQPCGVIEFDYSWEWFYDFFFVPEAEGAWGSEDSSALRSHLLSMAATLFKYHDVVLKETGLETTAIYEAIKELLEMVEVSKSHVVCFWTYGDESAKKDLDEIRAALPPEEQMARVLALPHVGYRMRRVSSEYFVIDEKTALKRYRNELADFNRRRKLAQKNQQREAAAEQAL